ncbi:MAG: hypothetical protein GY694_07375 [Gammaproteobacteria bacterium]|nr:hypothetical protein [Gammaproteobacteria bacterium]
MKSKIFTFLWVNVFLLLAVTCISQAATPQKQEIENLNLLDNTSVSTHREQAIAPRHTIAYYQMPQDSFALYRQKRHHDNNPYNQELILQKQNLIELSLNNDSLLMPEFQELNSQLEQKIEQAIRHNSTSVEESSVKQGELISKLSPLDKQNELSQLTSSSLIVSARKKQFLEKLQPVLMDDKRVSVQDNEKLKSLWSQFGQGNNLEKSDESWLRKMAEELRISELKGKH